jgi:hypothetical protein
MRAHIGDRLVVDNDPSRTGIVIAVTRADGSPPYVVKWLASGHIAMVSPNEYTVVIPAGTVARPEAAP